jgi:hypothetical protein
MKLPNLNKPVKGQKKGHVHGQKKVLPKHTTKAKKTVKVKKNSNTPAMMQWKPFGM